MLDFAYGELQLKPDEFWRLTWGEYYRMVRGYNRRSKIQATYIACIRADINNTIPRRKGHPKGDQPYTAEDFMRSEQPKQSVSELTEEERLKIARERSESLKRFKRGVKRQVMK